MRLFLLPAGFLLFLGLNPLFTQNPDAGMSGRSKVATELLTSLDRGEAQNVFVVFREKADVRGANYLHGKTAKAQYVYSRLQETASRSQANALRILRERQASANSYFLVNAIAVEQADPDLILRLAELPEVAAVAPDPVISLEPTRSGVPGPEARGTIEWGVDMINAPAVWSMGYTGQGVTVGGADTGYEWAHPALKPHYRGWNEQSGVANHNYNWHDAIREISPLAHDSIPGPQNNPCGLNSTQPCDDNDHGTHTMGTMTGDDGGDNQIGVAPGAKWVGCRNMERGNGSLSSYIECFQWFLAPTDLNGQNPDITKAPQVINNSWYCSGSEGCMSPADGELMRTAVINLRASGVVVVVSNGNKGKDGCQTTNDPVAYFEESFSVGATEKSDSVAEFSSRGPVTIDGSNRVKPNVVAPGAEVRSSTRFGLYKHFWGTSMSGPHVVGLVALVLSARPDLAGEVDLIEDIIEQTAVPKIGNLDCSDNNGQNYPNNSYGFGRVDALAAVQKALSITPVNAPAVATPMVGLFPNPVWDEAVFDLQNLNGETTLELFSAEGRRIFTKTWTAAGRSFISVSMGPKPNGVYFWKLNSAAGFQSGKLIKG